MDESSPPFYVTGGTIPRDAPSYVERRADEELYQALSRGTFCYVLTARQMGKSSLMVRTATRLREEGATVVVLDLTAVGQNVSAEQWYDGLLALMALQLGLEDELEEFWLAHERLGSLQRWMAALRQVVLPHCPGRVVLFIDEIDAVRSLPFRTDEFFAGIRECYNRRTQDPEFSRLTFCLLGVASPSDLIQDARMTPFNIGRRIELVDFTEAEAGRLAIGLELGEPGTPGRPRREARALLKRVLRWTGGHPYLTQRLCQALAADPSHRTSADVDRLCDELFLSRRAREQDDNLVFVRELLLRSEADRTALLDLYRQVREHRRVRDDETNPLCGLLKLSGVARAVQGYLWVRNRIYYRVFDREWVLANMPDAELRRQRAAYWQGVLRTGTVAAIFLGIMGVLAGVALYQRGTAHERLVRMSVAAGDRLVEEGDLFGALPWFVEALRLDRGSAARESIDRLRIGTTLQQCPKLTQLWLHAGPVNWAEFSPDGRRVSTASSDHTARIWDVETGAAVARPLRHAGAVISARFSPNGRLVVTASDDGTARVWDASTGGAVTPPLKHRAGVRYAEFSPDNRRVLTASADHTARVWEVPTGRAAGPVIQEKAPVFRAEFSPDGRRIATASEGGKAQVWDAATGAHLATLAGTEQVAYVTFSPDGRHLVTAQQWNALATADAAQVFEVGTARPVGSPATHHEVVTHACFSRDGRRIASASGDGTARVWDAARGVPVTPPLKHRGAVLCAEFSPDSRRVVTASQDGTARAWDAATGEPITPPLRHGGPVRRAAFSPDGRRILTSSGDGTARVWDLAPDAMAVLQLPGQAPRPKFSPDGARLLGGPVRAVQVWDARTAEPITPMWDGGSFSGRFWFREGDFSPDGRLVVTPGPSGAQVRDAGTGEPVAPFLPHGGEVYSTLFSPDGSRVLTASADGTARVWDTRTGRSLLPPIRHGPPVFRAVFSPDGRRIATASFDGTARVWDAATGRPVTPPLSHRSGADPSPGIGVCYVEFSPDSRRVVTAAGAWGLEPAGARVWNASSGAPVTPLLRHREGVWEAHFSPDGRRVLTASSDGTAQLWDAASGLPVTPPLQHQGQVDRADFSRDGRLIVTASWDGTARVWDAATGEPVSPPLQDVGQVRGVAFSPDARRVFTNVHDTYATLSWSPGHLRDLHRNDRPLPDLVAMAELLSGERIDPVSGAVPLKDAVLSRAWQRVRAADPDDFTVSPAQIWAWQEREAERCENGYQWGGVVTWLTRRLRAGNATSGLYERCATARINLGQWRQAAGDLASAAALRPADHQLGYRLALCRLAAGDTKGYRETCRVSLARFSQTEDPNTANGVAWTCALAPGYGSDLDLAIRLGEEAVAGQPNHAALNTLGGVLYRAGRFDAAIQRLRAGIAANSGRAEISDCLFLAMAHQRLGRRREARQWLAKAEAFVRRAATPGTWEQRIEQQLHRREAEALLQTARTHETAPSPDPAVR